MARGEDPLTLATLATLTRLGIRYEKPARAELESRWPQIALGPVTWAIHEPGSGALMARRAVQVVSAQAAREIPQYRQGSLTLLRPRFTFRSPYPCCKAGSVFRLPCDCRIFKDNGYVIRACRDQPDAGRGAWG